MIMTDEWEKCLFSPSKMKLVDQGGAWTDEIYSEPIESEMLTSVTVSNTQHLPEPRKFKWIQRSITELQFFTTASKFTGAVNYHLFLCPFTRRMFLDSLSWHDGAKGTQQGISVILFLVILWIFCQKLFQFIIMTTRLFGRCVRVLSTLTVCFNWQLNLKYSWQPPKIRAPPDRCANHI